MVQRWINILKKLATSGLTLTDLVLAEGIRAYSYQDLMGQMLVPAGANSTGIISELH